MAYYKPKLPLIVQHPAVICVAFNANASQVPTIL